MNPESGGPDRPLPIEELLATTDASPVYELIMEPCSAPPRKLTIEPTPDSGIWILREYEFNGCVWRRKGSEPLEGFST